MSDSRAVPHSIRGEDTLDEMLPHTYEITRWIENIGDRATAQWVRHILRSEVPGTAYVDDHDRTNYVRAANWSQ